MKKLPSIYKGSVTGKNINKEVYYSYLEEREEKKEAQILSSDKTLDEKLSFIFKSRGYPFNIPVHIKLLNKEFDTFLALKTKTSVITLDNEVIPIASIIDLQIKSK